MKRSVWLKNKGKASTLGLIDKWHYLKKECQFPDGSSVMPNKIIVKEIYIDDKTDQVIVRYITEKGEVDIKPLGYLTNYHEHAEASSILAECNRGKVWSL